MIDSKEETPENNNPKNKIHPNDVLAIKIGVVVLAVITVVSAGLFGLQKYADWQIARQQKNQIQIALKPAAKKVSVQTPAVQTTQPQPAPAQPKKLVKTPPPVVVPSPSSNVNGLTPVAPSAPASQNPASAPSGNSAAPAQVSYTSLNWSGYMATQGKFTSVSGSWVVPTVTGNGVTASTDAAWIGIGGVTAADLIQVGTFDNVTSSGQVTNYAFYEILPDVAQAIPSLTISPGDAIKASIIETSPGHWAISLNDLTTGGSYSNTLSYTSSYSSAEWIEEDPSYANGRLAPLDRFNLVIFSNCGAVQNGVNSNITQSQGQAIALVNRSGQNLAVPTVISSDGGGFTVTQQ
jgi:hypothetical protein